MLLHFLKRFRTIVIIIRHICFVLYFLPFSAAAQLCTGSLGDPVVNITFGNGNGGENFTAPGYTYTSNSCPNDGFYNIVTATSGCFGGSWHSVPGDHTGGGAFMLVNASNNPGDFFVSTVTGLCPNTTYEFSAWVMNVLNRSGGGIMPNITFRVETTAGTVLGSYNSGDIPQTPTPVWTQYGFYFTTNAGNTDVVIRMTNNAPGGIGNDLALDDITFRPCGPSLNSFITGNNGSDNIDVCVNDQQPYDFDAALSPGFISPVLQWQLSTDSGKVWTDIPGENSLRFHRLPGPAGTYWYRLTVAESGGIGIANCRIGSNVLKLFIHAKPLVNAGPDRIVIKGNEIKLNAIVTGESPVFLWSPPDFLNSSTVMTPVAKPLFDITYHLSAISSFGCTNEDFVTLKVVAGIFVPTAFTPNNDGKNDNWRIPYLDPSLGADVKVFNRYGQVVYHVTGSMVNWDGTVNGVPQPAGAYVYLINFKEKMPDMKGVVTLIR